jgi:hypothetical protein
VVDQPFSTHVSSMAACLPEQFMRTELRGSPARMSRSWVARSLGRSTGHWSAESSRCAAARMLLAASTWASSPVWLADATASCRASSVAPAVSSATACRGFTVERGSIAASAPPSAIAVEPVWSRATSEPKWRLSMKPERSIVASSAYPVASGIDCIMSGSDPAGIGRAATRNSTLLCPPRSCCAS